jgi:hypothetical protein
MKPPEDYLIEIGTKDIRVRTSSNGNGLLIAAASLYVVPAGRSSIVVTARKKPVGAGSSVVGAGFQRGD